MRDLAPDDVPALVELWVASWKEAMSGIDFEARRPWIATLLRTPTCATFVAEVPLGPLGFVTLGDAYLYQLVVAPRAKGSGLAVVLLDRAKAAFPEGLTLDVNQANTRAIRFYAREGFQRVRSGVNPASGLDTWAMRWPSLDGHAVMATP